MAIKKGNLRLPTLAAIEDCWQREATRVAIEKGRAVVSGGAIPPNTPIGRLSDSEWGWIVSAVLFGWICTRSRQATNNGVGSDKYFYGNDEFKPNPWDIGAIESILPELANCEINWSKPLGQMSRDDIVAFLNDALDLTRRAMLARDKGERMGTERAPDGTEAAKPETTDDSPEIA
jgi:hypothetical protein